MPQERSRGPEPAPDVGVTRYAEPREHAEALERVRAAIVASCAHQEQSRSLLAQAAELVGAARRGRRDSEALRGELGTHLRASVTGYVGALRADGVPAERVVVAVKGIVREATPPRLDVHDARALMDEVVRWSIEAYYAT
jgi:hypothetical protein